VLEVAQAGGLLLARNQIEAISQMTAHTPATLRDLLDEITSPLVPLEQQITNLRIEREILSDKQRRLIAKRHDTAESQRGPIDKEIMIASSELQASDRRIVQSMQRLTAARQGLAKQYREVVTRELAAIPGLTKAVAGGR
jgi:hypothetical protein